MTLVKQTRRTCGQAVVAMILDVPLSSACGIVGHKRGTQAKDLRAALRKSNDIAVGKPQMTRYHDIPSRAILRLSRPYGGNWHWMLMWDGVIYDPAQCYQKRLAAGWLITSFMAVSQ